MAEEPSFDVRRAIAASSSQSTLQELAKRGISRVKVIDEQMINKLIGEAVDRIVSTKTNLLTPEDRAKLINASRHELDRLMGEYKALKDKAELMAQDKQTLVADVENLQNQLRTERKLMEDTARQRYEDGKAILRAEVEDVRKKMAAMEEDLSRRIRREVDLEYQARAAADRATLEAAQSQIAQREKDLRVQFERREQDLREELTRREADIAARGASLKEAELRAKLEEMQAKNLEMAQRQTTLLEEMKKSEETVFTKLAELFTKSIEGVNKKLTDLRLRAIAGGPLVGAGAGDVEFRPSQVLLENLVTSELESNLKQMQVEAKTSGKISGALDRLKAMRQQKAGEETKEQRK